MRKNNCITEVYMATNLIDGKRYIGVTKKGISARRSDHFSHARSKVRPRTKFTSAIKKHGENVFDFRVLSSWPSYDLALEEEIRLIAILKPEYNTTIGGEGVFIANRSERKIWNKKISMSLKGRKMSAYTKQRLKECAHLRAKKNIICLNDGSIGTVREMSQKYKVKEKAIRAICVGAKGWTASNGYFFIKSDTQISDEVRFHLLSLKKKKIADRLIPSNRTRSRSVICLNTGKIYKSVTSAAKEHCLIQSRISQICNGEGKTKDGLMFMYADQREPPIMKYASVERKAEARKQVLAALARGQIKIKKKVICVDDGRVFNSITEASKEYGQHISSISAAIYRNGKAGGIKFEFARAA